MATLFSNNAITTLVDGVTDSATSVVVTDSSRFAIPTTPDYQVATLINAAETVTEIVKITANNTTTNTLTVVRGFEGTTPSAFATADGIFAGVTAGVLEGFGSGGGGGSGLQVLTDADYFFAGDSYVSIGDGSGTDGADFLDIYAFVDFINGVSARSTSAIFGYFKNPGVVTLTTDIHITNSQTFGNVYIQGAGVDNTPANAPWSDPIYLTVTAIVGKTATLVTLTVDSTTGLFVDGVIGLYPDANAVLPAVNQLIGAWRITAIDTGASTITIDFVADLDGLSSVSWAARTGLSIAAVFNRTVITGSKIVIEGSFGNDAWGGGFYNISFSGTNIIVMGGGFLLVYGDVHLNNCMLYIDVGDVITWGDVVIGGGGNTSIGVYANSSFLSFSNVYVGTAYVNYGNGVHNGSVEVRQSSAIFNKLYYSAANHVLNFAQHSNVLLVDPKIGNLGTYTPPSKTGTTVTVASTWADC